MTFYEESRVICFGCAIHNKVAGRETGILKQSSVIFPGLE